MCSTKYFSSNICKYYKVGIHVYALFVYIWYSYTAIQAIQNRYI